MDEAPRLWPGCFYWESEKILTREEAQEEPATTRDFQASPECEVQSGLEKEEDRRR
jgi:hypothetical protein